MNVWKVILVTLVIFSSGVMTGNLVTRRNVLSEPKPHERHASTNRPAMSRPDRLLRMEFLTRVREELELTPEQIEAIEGIVRDGQGRMRALWEEVSPRMRAEFNATQAEIREVLTPEQQAQFEDLMKRHPWPRRGDRDRREPGTGEDRTRLSESNAPPS